MGRNKGVGLVEHRSWRSDVETGGGQDLGDAQDCFSSLRTYDGIGEGCRLRQHPGGGVGGPQVVVVSRMESTALG